MIKIGKVPPADLVIEILVAHGFSQSDAEAVTVIGFSYISTWKPMTDQQKIDLLGADWEEKIDKAAEVMRAAADGRLDIYRARVQPSED